MQLTILENILKKGGYILNPKWFSDLCFLSLLKTLRLKYAVSPAFGAENQVVLCIAPPNCLQ